MVASEVKQPATQTARSTEEITRHVNEVSAIAGAIAAAVEKQGAATAEIARNVAETASAVNAMSSRNSEVSGEAGRAGWCAGDVLEGTKILDDAVSELRRAIIRTVRNSTEEVDRRLFKRHAVELACRIEGAGAPQSGHTQELSERGARLAGVQGFSSGGHGTLRIDGPSALIRFVVVGAERDAVRVSFDSVEAKSAGICALLEWTVVKSAD